MKQHSPERHIAETEIGFLDRLLGLALALAGLLLTFGWTLPVMTVETFYLFEDQITILGALGILFREGELLLFFLIGLFTVIFPVAKLVLAYWLWWRLGRSLPSGSKLPAWIETLGKWSMLDVFVVALLIVVLKLSLLSDVTVEPGLYVFAIGVIASMATVQRIRILALRQMAARPG